MNKLREMQKELNTDVNPSLSAESKVKIDKIHEYLKEAGPFFKDVDLTRYSKNVPRIEKQFPTDYLYKILII